MSVLFLCAAYLSGSIPFGIFIARARTGQDVRSIGSGNIGATNVARAAGRGAAAATLVLDALKAFLPALLALHARRRPGWLGDPEALGAACAVAAVVGHCFPVWLRLRGGKGVAPGLGAALALSPPGALAGAAAWLVLYKLFRISSIGSLAGVFVTVAVASLTAPGSAVLALAIVAGLILLRHRSNLARLLRREERPVG